MEQKDMLKQLRNDAGMTQKQFATKYEIPLSTYEQWEMGIRKPPMYVVKMIALIEYLVKEEQHK